MLNMKRFEKLSRAKPPPSGQTRFRLDHECMYLKRGKDERFEIGKDERLTPTIAEVVSTPACQVRDVHMDA